MGNKQPIYHMWNISFVEGKKPVNIEKLVDAIKDVIKKHKGKEPDVEVCEPEYGDPADLDKF